ncbi:MAG: flavin reductase family protein, partial [Paludibacteraceae bacterium]|nr:flavin reductase family protein [Paludibacteraceae bacterium]
EFVINLTNEKLAKAADWCGVRSGKNVDKWEKMGLTPGKSEKVSAPTIEEAPISIECRVKQVVELGTHDMFISEVVNVQADDKYIDPVTGAFDEKKADFIAYNHGNYYKIGDKIGKFGWTVEKRKKGNNK